MNIHVRYLTLMTFMLLGCADQGFARSKAELETERVGTDVATAVSAKAACQAAGLPFPCEAATNFGLKTVVRSFHKAKCKDQVTGWSHNCSKLSKKDMKNRIGRCSDDQKAENGKGLTQNCKRGFVGKHKDECWFEDEKGNQAHYTGDKKSFDKANANMPYVRCKNWN